MIINGMLRRILHLNLALITFGAGVFSCYIYRFFHDAILPRHVLESATPSAESTQPLPQDPQFPIIQDPRWKGIVLVQSRTDLDGHVIEAIPLLGDEDFYQRAVEATYKLRFARQKYKGHRIGTIGCTTYKFVGASIGVYQASRGFDDGTPLGPPSEWNN